jgi:hypothetical protein
MSESGWEDCAPVLHGEPPSEGREVRYDRLERPMAASELAGQIGGENTAVRPFQVGLPEADRFELTLTPTSWSSHGDTIRAERLRMDV